MSDAAIICIGVLVATNLLTLLSAVHVRRCYRDTLARHRELVEFIEARAALREIDFDKPALPTNDKRVH